MTPEEIARRSAEAMWANDRASRGLGMRIDEVGPGRAVVSMELSEDMLNGYEIGHGGLTFTLGDSAFAVACNSYNRVTVAAGAQIRFRRPTHLGDTLVATATEVSREGRDGVYDVQITRDGEIVAEFTGQSKELDPPASLF